MAGDPRWVSKDSEKVEIELGEINRAASATDHDVKLSTVSSRLLISPEISWRNLTVVSTSLAAKVASQYGLTSFVSKLPFLSLDETPLVKNASGQVKGGLCGIFGPSGSGKTTILNALAKRLDPLRLYSSGDVRINGKPYSHSDLKSFSGYVMQDDLLNPVFTVAETLHFHAEILLSGELDKASREQRAAEVLTSLGLDHCAHVIVGDSRRKGISGGERKRLAIAIELLSQPSLLLLDEPTSGLDSANALALIERLKNIAETKDVTIITTLHQPQSKIFDLLDQVILMSHGEIVFNGRQSEVVRHFEQRGYAFPDNANPADHLIDTISSKAFKDSFSAFSTEANKSEKVVLSGEHEFPKRQLTPWLTQLWILIKRAFLNNWREIDVYVIHFIAYVIVASFIGAAVWRNIGNTQASIELRRPAIYFCVVFQGVVSTFLGSCKFPLERALMLRERQGGSYAVSSYFIAKTSVDSLWDLPALLAFSLITYYQIGFVDDSAHFIRYFVFIILTNNACIALANAISCVFVSIEMATVINAFTFEITRMFGGWFLNPLQIAAGFDKWSFFLNTSYVSYGFFGAVQNEFRDLPLRCLKSELGAKGVCKYTNGNQIISLYGYDTAPLTISLCYGMLFVLILVHRVVGYLGLRYIKF